MTIEEAAAVSVAAVVAEEAAVVAAAAVEEAAAAVAAVSDQLVHERCIKQLVQTVSRKLKYLSSPVATDLCTAKNVSRNINLQDTNSKRTHI